MARYIKQEMPDLLKTGERKAYYRLENSGNVTTDALIGKICAHPGLGVGEGAVRHVLATVAGELAHLLAEGHSVTLDGVGTFMATLAARKAKDGGRSQPGAEHNADTIAVNGVKYRADQQLVRGVAQRCTLERGATRRVNSSPHAPAERLAMALAYLDDPGHPYLKVKAYAALTGLPYSTASTELARLAADPASGLAAQGRGPAKAYVKRRQ